MKTFLQSVKSALLVGLKQFHEDLTIRCIHNFARKYYPKAKEIAIQTGYGQAGNHYFVHIHTDEQIDAGKEMKMLNDSYKKFKGTKIYFKVWEKDQRIHFFSECGKEIE